MQLLERMKEVSYVKTRPPDIKEIEYAVRCAYQKSYFSYSFEALMFVQKEFFPDIDIPFIIVVLIDMIRENGGIECNKEKLIE